MKKFLFVTRVYPDDFRTAVYGVYQRMRMFLEAVSRASTSVEILFFVPAAVASAPGAAENIRAQLAEHWRIDAAVSLCPLDDEVEAASVWGDYGSPALGLKRQRLYRPTAGPTQARAVRAALESKPDAVFVHRLTSMVPVLEAAGRLPPLFFDLDDIEHVKFAREIHSPPTWPGKYLHYLQLPALLAGETAAIRRSRKTFVCSEPDRRYLSGRLRLPQTVTIPNAIHLPAEIAPPPPSATLAFIGSYTYQPNVVAAQHLVGRIWPLIRSRLPEAHLLIGGNRPDMLTGVDLSQPGISFVGFVEDIDAFYAAAQVVACPILAGGGTRIKIIEAAAYGRPVVSTSVGAEGLVFRDEADILLADAPTSFADRCVELLIDPDRCARMGASGRAVAQAHYSRSGIVDRIIQELS